MNSKSLLVAGGAGYIGTTLIRDALELGYNVICLDLLVYGGKPLSAFFNHPRFKFIQGDIRNKKLLNSILKDIDLVVNLAAIVGDKPCQAAPDSAVSINSLGAKILADCCIKHSGKYFLSLYFKMTDTVLVLGMHICSISSYYIENIKTHKKIITTY